ncbi:MAG: peptidylprolyl isomerase [Candidatus Micrarchaeia archaeon]|jgi:peptidylprolyl isomerase
MENAYAIPLVFILFASLFGCASPGAPGPQPAARALLAEMENQSVMGDLIADNNAAAAGDTVSVNYIGKLTSGELFDTSIKEEAQKAGFPLRPSYSPLSFKVGAGQMIPGFDAAVVGMRAGEEKTVTLPPEQAYGQPSPDAIVSIPVANIGNSASIKVGTLLSAQNGATGKVVELNGTHAKVDFNHELAGQSLVFTIRMVSVQKAR